MQAVLKDMETRMNAALDGLSREFATVRTGRASTALLDSIRVDYYGNPTPISQMATDMLTIVIRSRASAPNATRRENHSRLRRSVTNVCGGHGSPAGHHSGISRLK